MMTRTYAGQQCTVARSLEVVGERWTLLIVRDALLGVTRFEGFRETLGIPRNVLTARLNLLVEHHVLKRVQYQPRPVRHEYRLTEKGRGLAPVVRALLSWGDEYYADDLVEPPTRVVHVGCGGRVLSQAVCESCDRPLESPEITAVRVTGTGA
jgi:DNA-binding HxlR family transcriptional regulator